MCFAIVPKAHFMREAHFKSKGHFTFRVSGNLVERNLIWLPNQVSFMAGEAGLEPTNDGVKVRCLTAWLLPKVLF